MERQRWRIGRRMERWWGWLERQRWKRWWGWLERQRLGWRRKRQRIKLGAEQQQQQPQCFDGINQLLSVAHV